MKIIHTSDWHIGKTLYDYPLLDDQSYFLDCFINEMNSIKPDVILICGDIYDRSVPSGDAVALLNQALSRMTAELDAKIMLISGNHDSKERLDFGRTLFKKSGVYICGKPSLEIQKVTLSDKFGDVDFYLIPYIDLYDVKSIFFKAELNFPEDIKTSDAAFSLLCNIMFEHMDKENRNILLCHGFFANVENNTEYDALHDVSLVGGSELISLEKFKAFDYIAAGHIHGTKKISDNARYCGSPLKYSIDEASQKKLYLEIDLNEKGSILVTEHPIIPKHEVRIFEGFFEEIICKAHVESENLDDYIFVELLDLVPIPDVIIQLKSVFPNVLGVSFKEVLSNEIITNTQTISELEKKSVSDLFSEFYEENTGTKLSAEQAKISEEIILTLRQSEVF